jgi:hypothetical protein
MAVPEPDARAPADGQRDDGSPHLPKSRSRGVAAATRR